MKTQITMRSFYLEGEIEGGVLTVLKSEGDMSIKGYLTTKEASDALGVSKRRIREFLADGRLTGRKIGNVWLIDSETVDRMKSTPRPEGWRKGKPRK